MDWTNGPLDCWPIFGLFLDYFLDHFLDQFFSTIDSWGGVGRSFSSFVGGGVEITNWPRNIDKNDIDSGRSRILLVDIPLQFEPEQKQLTRVTGKLFLKIPLINLANNKCCLLVIMC